MPQGTLEDRVREFLQQITHGFVDELSGVDVDGGEQSLQYVVELLNDKTWDGINMLMEVQECEHYVKHQ